LSDGGSAAAKVSDSKAPSMYVFASAGLAPQTPITRGDIEGSFAGEVKCCSRTSLIA
jgi:hypothetical protein